MLWVLLIIVFIILIVLAVNYENKKAQNRADELSEKLNSIENFKVTRKIGGYKGFFTFAIDNDSEKICLVTPLKTQVYNYSDIIGVEIIEDGSTISKKSTSRTIGGAIIGGVLAGGAGTIVGGLSGNSTQKNKVSTLTVKILLRNIQNPSLTITCFDSQTMTTEGKSGIETEGKVESYIYKIGKQNAEQIKDLISVIIDQVDKNEGEKNNPINPSTAASNSISDELLKLNDLKEKGILTEEEFIDQKNKLLKN